MWLRSMAALYCAAQRSWTPRERGARLRLAIEEHFLGRASPPGRTRTAGPADAQVGSPRKERDMSVYRVTEVIGTSSTSWEDAAAEAIRTAAGTIRDLRVAEVVKQDISLDEGGSITYRTKLQLSFKYEQER
jgi:dodecin